MTGFCAGIEPATGAHAAALSETDDERVLLTGDALVRGIDAGCS